MKKSSFKFLIPAMILVIVWAIYITRPAISKGTMIELKGNNDILSVSLNMNTGYNNELVVKLISEEFMPPPQVYVEILVRGRSVYVTNLKKQNENFLQSGIYKESFNSFNEIEENHKEISVAIVLNGKSEKIRLNSIEILK